MDTNYLKENCCIVKNEIRTTRSLKHKLQTDPYFVPHFAVEENSHSRKIIRREDVMHKPVERLCDYAKDMSHCVINAKVQDIAHGIEEDLRNVEEDEVIDLTKSNKEKVAEAIKKVFKKHVKGFWISKKVSVLLSLLKDDNGILNGNVHNKIKEEIVASNFIEIFILWRIQQAIDQTGSGGLSYKGIDTIREAVKRVFPIKEPENSNIKTRRKLLMPSSFLVKQVASDLEKYANNFMQYTIEAEPYECVKFNFIQLSKFILKMHGLDELAANTNDVEISITLDGSKLISNLFHVTAGLKVVDVRAKEPETGKFLMTLGNL